MKDLLLLGLLLDEKKHGYQINEYFQHFLSFCAEMKKSTAYYTLNKLEKEGYVAQEMERKGNRPERRVYQITDGGRKKFFELLRQNLGGYYRTYYDDDIGIAFMDQLSREETHQLLKEKRDKTEATLSELQNGPVHSGSVQYVIEHSIAHLRAERDWLNQVLEEI